MEGECANLRCFCESVPRLLARIVATDCKFNDAMRPERLRDRLVSGIQDKRMMSELLKLKLEELTFDIAVAKCIAIEQSYKDVEALQRGKESNPVDLLSKSRPNKKPKPKKEARPSEKKSSPSPKEPGDQSCYRCLGNHDHKSCPYKRENVTSTVTRLAILRGLVNPRKGRHKLPGLQ